MRLYRVISESEFRDLHRCNRFRAISGTLTSKWFAESLDDCAEWGQWFTRVSGVPHVIFIEIELSADLANQFITTPKRDNIGPARCATLEQLKGVKWKKVER